jgi:hypothetical protein
MAGDTHHPRPGRPHWRGFTRHSATYTAREVVRIAVGSGGTGLVIGLVGGSFSAAGIVSMTVAAIMLLMAWVFGTVAITVSEPVWGLPPNYRLGTSLSAIIALGLALGGIGWFQYGHMPIADKGVARVNLDTVTFEKIPGQSNSRIDVSLKNSGNAIALEYAAAVAGRLASTPLSSEQIPPLMDKLRNRVIEFDATGHHMNRTLIPNTNQLIWLSDVDKIDNDYILLTDQQIQDFNDGKLSVYLFLFGRYEDETITGTAYWQIEMCIQYVGTLSYWHNCGPQKMDKIIGSRFH